MTPEERAQLEDAVAAMLLELVRLLEEEMCDTLPS
jgi:hypothetical protein